MTEEISSISSYPPERVRPASARKGFWRKAVPGSSNDGGVRLASLAAFLAEHRYWPWAAGRRRVDLDDLHMRAVISRTLEPARRP